MKPEPRQLFLTERVEYAGCAVANITLFPIYVLMLESPNRRDLELGKERKIWLNEIKQYFKLNYNFAKKSITGYD